MVQDRRHQKRRGILEETVSTRREAKEAQGREPGGRVRGDRSRVVHVGGDWACAGVEAGAVDGAEHRVNGAGTGTGSGFSVRQRRVQMVWFEGAMEGEEGRTGVRGIMVM